MFDGFWHGIFGGVFGHAIAKWLSRFKYWVIFLVVTLATQACFIAVGIKAKGLKKAIEIIFMSGFDPLFILVPMGIGSLAVFVTFIGSLSAPKKYNHNKPE